MKIVYQYDERDIHGGKHFECTDSESLGHFIAISYNFNDSKGDQFALVSIYTGIFMCKFMPKNEFVAFLNTQGRWKPVDKR